MLEIATSNTDRLVRLINDILDIQRIEAGKATLHRRPVAVAELLATAEATMAAMAQEAEVKLRVEVAGEPVADADPDRVLQTLTNLLSNAIKFSPAGSAVDVTAGVEDGRVAIAVTDRGRGIPAAQLDRIFERFEQVDASDARERGGSGLGLAIARGIVRQHGGELTVSSEEGRGSTFHFDLPVAEPAPAAEHKAPTVLVGDADPEQRGRSAALLAGWGYDVVDAASCDEAVAAARQKPQLILLDAGLAPGGASAGVGRLRAVTAAPVVLVGALDAVGGTPPLRLAKSSSRESLADAVGPGALALIVEDEPALASVLAAQFERRGVRTERAGSVAEAAAALDRLAPDLIVLDLMLPDGDGAEIVDRLREQRRLGSVAIVAYTARDTDPADDERLAGAEVLTKGRIGPAELERRAMGLIGRAAGADR